MRQAKVYTAAFHIIGWLLFFTLMFVFTVNFPLNQDEGELVPGFLFFCAIYLLVFYLNAYVLLPRFYFRKKFLVYILVVAALFGAVCFLKPFENLQHPQTRTTAMQNDALRPDGPPPHFPGQPPPQERLRLAGRIQPVFDIVSIILFFMTWAFSTVLQLVNRWQKTERRAKQAEVDKANAELSFLKAQINPHFLFNTLNNIYSMALSKSEHTPTAILKLSNIMRYVTDEVNQEFVPLQSEIDCTADYIMLQRLRISPKVPVEFEVSGDTLGKEIAPMVFMTFVENVFKYGVSSHEPAPITIRIETDKEEVRFYCSNRIFPVQKTLERAGIGIANTKARLERLYPGRHQLEISRNGDFRVELTIRTTTGGPSILK